MRIKMISFRANGEHIECVTEKPAFYGLSVNGVILEYFNSVKALRHAVDSLKVFERDTQVNEVTAKLAA